MAFFVVNNQGMNCTWHVNSHPQHFDPAPGSIVYFQADGDELEYIIRHVKTGLFGGFPFSYHLCIWRQPWAQFLWDNLPYTSNKPRPKSPP